MSDSVGAVICHLFDHVSVYIMFDAIFLTVNCSNCSESTQREAAIDLYCGVDLTHSSILIQLLCFYLVCFCHLSLRNSFQTRTSM